jgi:hypothetical protein
LWYHNAAALLACGSTEESGLDARLGESRNRKLPLKVFVTDAERARIEERARTSGLSVSAYLRAAGLGHPIRSVLDQTAVLELAKLNGDQGRLGGLLKLWLVDRPGRGAPEHDVRQLLDRIGELQSRLADVVGRV